MRRTAHMVILVWTFECAYGSLKDTERGEEGRQLILMLPSATVFVSQLSRAKPPRSEGQEGGGVEGV